MPQLLTTVYTYCKYEQITAELNLPDWKVIASSVLIPQLLSMYDKKSKIKNI